MEMPSFEGIKAMIETAEGICGDTITKSEFHNETWMLRLVLALLAEFKGNPSRVRCYMDGEKPIEKDSEKAFAAMNDVRDALKTGWISEGGLTPVFKKEKTTWTDAILGMVHLSKENRAVCLNDDKGGYNGVIVIEAKMGSDLSPGVVHDEHYDQAARNIACLSRFVLDCGIDLGKTRFLVVAPKLKLVHWKEQEKKKGKKHRIYDPDEMIKNANETVENTRREYREGMNKDRLKDNIERIQKNSCAISWEYILAYMRGHVDGKKFHYLREYYSSINF